MAMSKVSHDGGREIGSGAGTDADGGSASQHVGTLHPEIAEVIAGTRQWTVICADCLQILPTIPAGSVGACISDPPYGIGWDVGVNPYGNVRARFGKAYVPIHGDDVPFDPAPLLAFRRCVLWGANHYADKLPTSGAWFVWDKRVHVASTDQSDCELAWSNVGNRASMIRYMYHGGGSIAKENGVSAGRGVPVSLHPTQKPVAVMIPCIEAASEVGEVVLDPFAGVGSTGVAAVQTGRRFIGIEIDEKYADIARRRIADAAPLFVPPVERVPDPALFAGETT